MKFNLGSKNKETFNKMIKSAGSAAELFNSNVKKTKTKNCSDLKAARKHHTHRHRGKVQGEDRLSRIRQRRTDG